MDLRPDVVAILESAGRNGPEHLIPRPDATPDDVERALAALRVTPARPVVAGDPVTSENLAIPDGTRVRVYRDPATPAGAPIVLFLHGGGWVLGDLDMHDHVCRWIAARSLIVVSVDYRLAPEHPYPAALDDVSNALDWIVDHAEDLEGDATKIIAFGTSAGANLAGALALRETVSGRSRVAVQVLAYPVTDWRRSSASYHENATGYMLTATQMTWFWQQYAPGDVRRDPFVSLVDAEGLVGSPPAIILTAEYDPLRDEGATYAQRLADAGVSTEYVQVDGVIHGFIAMGPHVGAARPALEDLIDRALRTIDLREVRAADRPTPRGTESS